MLTLCQKYQGSAIGQGDAIAIMQIWDKWYVVLPCPVASRKLFVNRHWLAHQCEQGLLIANKIGGCWWIAVREYENSSQGCVTCCSSCDTVLETQTVNIEEG